MKQQLTVASQKTFKYPREIKAVHRVAYKEEIEALRIRLAWDGLTRAFTQCNVYRMFANVPTTRILLSRLHEWYTLSSTGVSEVLTPDGRGEYWVEFKKKQWREALNATAGTSDRALESLSYGVIERQSYRLQSGFFVFRIRPIRCGRFKGENQTLLGKDDHLLQHNFDLNGNLTCIGMGGFLNE